MPEDFSPDEPAERERPRTPERHPHAELAALTTAILLLACWVMIVL